MRKLSDADDLRQQLGQGAALVLFGGPHCSVCNAVRPQLERRLPPIYPQLRLFYVDCEAAPAACAQYGIYSVPVVQVYFDGDRFIEHARVFGLGALIDEIERPYRLWTGAD